MCGRYTITTPLEGLRAVFLFEESPNLAPRYNVAPSQDVPVIRLNAEGRRELAMVRWGLIPFWAKDKAIGYKMINARAETVAQKPAFREALQRRRCLVVADGFYEWQKREEGPKQPHHITLKGGGPMAFAGLWERWADRETSETVQSCTIVVTEANELLRPIHDRMPVIIAPEDFDAWLDASGGPEVAQALLRPFPSGALEDHPVSTRVNKPQNDDPSLIEPLEADP